MRKLGLFIGSILMLLAVSGCIQTPSTPPTPEIAVVTTDSSTTTTPTSFTTVPPIPSTTVVASTVSSTIPHVTGITPNFVDKIDNPYFPLKPGTKMIYSEVTEDGKGVIETYVTNQTKEILNVTCTVVRDTVKFNGKIEEDTLDWYAQDNEGNVWYFGEDSKEYKNGRVVSTKGSWEAGVDGAKQGIIMRVNPMVGDTYQQEYYKGEAEDYAKVVKVGETVTTPYGSFSNCLVTEEWTPLEPGKVTLKYYAPGIGVVRENMTLGGFEQVELLNITMQ
ncbi:MAG: hypothetical protein V1744_00675 [Candidatus Altiarchaeota archaeon]